MMYYYIICYLIYMLIFLNCYWWNEKNCGDDGVGKMYIDHLKLERQSLCPHCLGNLNEEHDLYSAEEIPADEQLYINVAFV